MARIAYDAKTRELAFRLWRESGQNVSAAIRALQTEYGYTKLQRQTLCDWMQEGKWQDRAARLQAEEDRAEMQKLLGRERILADLDAQKRRYESYLDALPPTQVDNAATTAYANLCKVIMSMQDKIESGAGLSKLDLAKDMLAQQFAFVRKTYPQHVAAFMEIMEPFADKLVELYG